MRELSYRARGQTFTHRINPSEYACRILAAQLADAWIDYHHKAALKHSGQYPIAIRSFVRFAELHLSAAGVNPAEARLDDTRVDLTEIFYEWERDLKVKFTENSQRPWNLATALLVLLHHRAERDPKVPEKLRRRAEAQTTLRKATEQPLDEFSNAERVALKGAAQNDLRALERRLVRGRDLLDQGKDPREHGWSELPNLVWAARNRILTTDVLKENLPKYAKHWPRELQDARPLHLGSWYSGVFGLMQGTYALLFPQELDLHPFRVLLLLAMTDCTTEELHALQLSDLDFNPQGVRIVQIKNRAHRVRADFHMAETGAQEDPGDLEYEGNGRWDVPGLLRRLIQVNDLTRETFEPEPWLFTAVEPARRRRMEARFASFVGHKQRFTHWITLRGASDGGSVMSISQPHDARRLRKTSKTAKVVALGGTLTDMAGDDHSIRVFHGHYAHGTTAHVLAGQAMNRAQQAVFDKVTAKPVLVTTEAQSRLGEPEVATALGISPGQGVALRDGELDMGVSNCKDPHNSPHSVPGQLCHVAPAMCMVCGNAVVFVSHLPQQLLLADHIEHMRLTLPPPTWQAVWGRQAKALAEVFAECAEQIPAARQAIAENDIRLNLPLGMRTEYDR
ncbi:hypothetical protein OG548_35730 [Streptomyces sp. NBC_01356]|uniref:hypothetical protein n=1 Tax=Streptomyces sp. NBC_01356 TaxID=2903836 RepID=UPI002E357309|nr:hypothetical protein [Streptomyces sp. NBC_01356]